VEESINNSRTEYSTALKYVLMKRHLSYEEYRDYVFPEIDYDGILKKDENIIKLLESINKPLFIMSNGTKEHVKKTLTTLGIEHLFKAVFYLGYDSNNYVGKPDVEAYQLVEQLTNARKIYFFDDKERNTSVTLSPKWSCHVTTYENIHNRLREVLMN
ncbi:Haloacid dehalogenase-like hydrolase, partial [Trachipleistophora hominis]